MISITWNRYIKMPPATLSGLCEDPSFHFMKTDIQIWHFPSPNTSTIPVPCQWDQLWPQIEPLVYLACLQWISWSSIWWNWKDVRRSYVMFCHMSSEFEENLLPKSAPLLILQKIPQRMRVFSIHINFRKHVKLHIVASHKVLDFLIWSRFLIPKLIAGKAENL